MLSGEPERRRRRPRTGDAHSKGVRVEAIGLDTCSQSILYGAQNFSLEELFAKIVQCKARGVRVALSIDGTKKSGDLICDVASPPGLFEREVMVNCGRSMLKRFQMEGRTLETEEVSDRLLLTY
jgi:DNA adenine methylase